MFCCARIGAVEIFAGLVLWVLAAAVSSPVWRADFHSALQQFSTEQAASPQIPKV